MINYNGLTEDEVIINRRKYGTNELTKVKQKSFFKILLESLGDPIIKILLIALGIKILFIFSKYDWYETFRIKKRIIFLLSRRRCGKIKRLCRKMLCHYGFSIYRRNVCCRAKNASIWRHMRRISACDIQALPFFLGNRCSHIAFGRRKKCKGTQVYSSKILKITHIQGGRALWKALIAL